MAGIKGGSKACRTCLRRKKGPSCEQCLKARIPCGGYPTELVIIRYTGKPDSRRCSSSTTTTTTASPSLHEHCLIQQQIQKRPKCPTTVTDLASHSSLAWSADEANLCGLFWDLYLPNGRALPLDMVRNTLGGWITSVQDLHTTEPVLRKAMLALSLVTVGKAKGCTAMVRAGAEVYGQALIDASKALRSTQFKRKDALYATIRLFSIHEVLHGGDEKSASVFGGRPLGRPSWRAHVGGDFAFVAFHPPSFFASAHNHQLFVDGRLCLGVLAVRARKRTFLTNDSWMIEPWTVYKRTPRDLLIDILLLLPGLFEDLDGTLKYPLLNQELSRRNLIERCVSIQDRLLHWHGLYSASPRLATCEEEIPESVKAVDLAVAHHMSLYWAIGIMVTTLIDSLTSSTSPSLSSTGSSFQTRHTQFNSDDLCRNLINIIPICMHPDAGLFRTSIIATQLIVATLHFSVIPKSHMLKERLWLMKILQKPECSSIAEFVWGLGCVGAEVYNPMSRSPWPLHMQEDDSYGSSDRSSSLKPS